MSLSITALSRIGDRYITTFNPEYIGIKNQIQEYYPVLKECKYVPEMEFTDTEIIITDRGRTLKQLRGYLSDEDKVKIKGQIIDSLWWLYENKIAHRDYHAKNVCWDGEQIWLIDWERVSSCEVGDIESHWDIVGSNGVGQYVFKYGPSSIIVALHPISFTVEDLKQRA